MSHRGQGRPRAPISSKADEDSVDAFYSHLMEHPAVSYPTWSIAAGESIATVVVFVGLSAAVACIAPFVFVLAASKISSKPQHINQQASLSSSSWLCDKVLHHRKCIYGCSALAGGFIGYRRLQREVAIAHSLRWQGLQNVLEIARGGAKEEGVMWRKSAKIHVWARELKEAIAAEEQWLQRYSNAATNLTV